MSLHSSGSSGRGGGLNFLVLLPPEIGIPVIIVVLLVGIFTAVHDSNKEPQWRAVAERNIVAWASKAYVTDDVKLLQCRREKGAIFHCDLSIGQGDQLRKVVTADCDGSKPGRCEACNE